MIVLWVHKGVRLTHLVLVCWIAGITKHTLTMNLLSPIIVELEMPLQANLVRMMNIVCPH